MRLQTRTRLIRLAVIAVTAPLLVFAESGKATEQVPAKQIFGGIELPSRAAPAPYGFYSKGCISGAVALPTDGPTWQAMRLSRNRRWGHPQMISLLEQLAHDAPKVGWPGLLVGDVSQPRGGPMMNGHASHQIGLDADIWLTPMPDRRLSAKEREDLPFTSMLRKDKFLTVDSRLWTPSHARLIMLAASYPQVERVFVNPAIKKKLCDTWTGDRSLLGKVRPIYGHDAHFHVRIKCPVGASGCKSQAAPPPGDGCDKSLAWWFTPEPWAKPKTDPKKPAPKPREIGVADLPKSCVAVLNAPSVANEGEVTLGGGATPVTAYAAVQPAAAPEAAMAGEPIEAIPEEVPVPLPRPLGR